MIATEIVSPAPIPQVAARRGGLDRRRFARPARAGSGSGACPPGVRGPASVRIRRRANVGDWNGLGAAIRGADMPILSGLRYILERERR